MKMRDSEGMGCTPESRIRINYLLTNVKSTLEGSTLFNDLLLQQGNGVDKLLGTRRAAGNVNIDGNPLVDSLHDRIVIEDSAGGGASAHGDDPLRLGHLHVKLAD